MPIPAADRLQDRKGVNLPGAALGGVPAMSPENRADLAFAVREDVDYMAASFVRTAADVREIRRVLASTAAAASRSSRRSRARPAWRSSTRSSRRRTA